jgi:hypothetical protein
MDFCAERGEGRPPFLIHGSAGASPSRWEGLPRPYRRPALPGRSRRQSKRRGDRRRGARPERQPWTGKEPRLRQPALREALANALTEQAGYKEACSSPAPGGGLDRPSAELEQTSRGARWLWPPGAAALRGARDWSPRPLPLRNPALCGTGAGFSLKRKVERLLLRVEREKNQRLTPKSRSPKG